MIKRNIDIKLFTENGFREQDESTQLKEIYTVFGIVVSELNLIDSYFINFLRQNFYEFEGNMVGKPKPEKDSIKYDTHLQNKATLGLLINDFKDIFQVNEFEKIFIELLRIRNLIVHKYMRENHLQLPSDDLRNEIYDDLLYTLNFIRSFNNSLNGHMFYTIKHPKFGMRWNPIN